MSYPHKLIRKFNARNIELSWPNDTGDKVEVLQNNGKRVFCPWRGIINRRDAERIGRPVRLLIARVDGVDLLPGQYVHGCYAKGYVYAVSDIAIITDDIQG